MLCDIDALLDSSYKDNARLQVGSDRTFQCSMYREKVAKQKLTNIKMNKPLEISIAEWKEIMQVPEVRES